MQGRFCFRIYYLICQWFNNQVLEYNAIYHIQYHEECRDFTKFMKIRKKTITTITTEVYRGTVNMRKEMQWTDQLL